MMRSLAVMVLGLVLALPCAAEPSMVILVRHAEKVDDSRDPPLSAAGHARAEALAAVLADAAVDAVVVTQFRRTQQTAAVVAERRGIAPQIVAAGEEGHVAAVAEAVRAHDGVVLVVGHSNTVTQIVHALGGPPGADLADDAYSDLFVLRPGGGLVRARYGAPSPDHP